MQHHKTAQASAGAFGARAIILLALVAGLLVMLGQARDARADHGGTFGFLVSEATVNEGETLELSILVNGRDSVSGPNVSLGIDVQLISAEVGDVGNTDFCIPIAGNVGAIVPLQIGTIVDADTVDETLSVALTFNSGTVNCANSGGGHAIVGGQTTVAVTINDTGTGGGGEDGNTFHFTTTGSTANEGDNNFAVNVTRTGDLDGAASVDCVVVGGGSAEASDYDIDIGTASFGDNDPSANCVLDIEADADADVFETLILGLDDPSDGHTIAQPDEHTITIVDDTAELVQFNAASYTVDEDDGVLNVTVQRLNPDGEETVVCRTVEQTGEADEDEDYTETDDILNFDSDDMQETCSIPILDDNEVEGDETFLLTLEVTSGDAAVGADATVTIEDDELGITFQFSAINYNVNEGNTSVVITVTRSSGVGTGNVDWDLSNGTAIAGSDYVDDSGTVFFSNGETSDTFEVDILQDEAVEGNQTILLSLSDPVGGTLGTPNTATVTIIDDEGIPTVTNVSPNTLNVAGGQSVVITGTNFTGATAVTFCGTNATSFVVNNSTQITAVAPARTAGVCDVRVTNPAGQSANTGLDNVTYQVADTTVVYQLSSRWSLIAWLGQDNASIPSALQGQSGLANNNIFSLVTAVATWNNQTQQYLFWFPGGANVPGANDITQFDYGTAYWIAVTANVNWTVVEGP